MTTIRAVPISKEGFAPYGRYYNLYEEGDNVETEDFRFYMIPRPLIDEPLNLGITCVKAGDFDSVSMERHVLTEEMLFCGDADMVLTVANSDPEGLPFEKDVGAFVMKPGDIAVLGLGTWHDANHGVDKDTMYYFLAANKDPSPDSREIEWVPIQPGPVRVLVK